MADDKDTQDDGVMRFSLELDEIEVELKDPKTKEVDQYILREMDGSARDKYLGFIGAKMNLSGEGDSTLKDFDGLQANLLARCLFKLASDGERTCVEFDVIQSFPARVQTALFNKAKQMSGMDDDAEDTAGND